MTWSPKTSSEETAQHPRWTCPLPGVTASGSAAVASKLPGRSETPAADAPPDKGVWERPGRWPSAPQQEGQAGAGERQGCSPGLAHGDTAPA